MRYAPIVPALLLLMAGCANESGDASWAQDAAPAEMQDDPLVETVLTETHDPGPPDYSTDTVMGEPPDRGWNPVDQAPPPPPDDPPEENTTPPRKPKPPTGPRDEIVQDPY